ncbi:MAG: hypothetical protein R3D59_00765 [Paracoccaceae bacterium]
MVNLILVSAAAGFVIGVLNITGLGFALTSCWSIPSAPTWLPCSWSRR